RQVIGGDDIALRDMVFLCDPSERLAALDDNVRRDRGTGGWAITRRGAWRRNIRTLPARGQKRTASQYQRRDKCPVQIQSKPPPGQQGDFAATLLPVHGVDRRESGAAGSSAGAGEAHEDLGASDE